MNKLAITIICILFANISFSKDGKILFLKGSIYINNNLAKQGDKFNFEDTLKTGRDSLAVLSIKPATTIKLKENSELIVPTPHKKNKVNKNTYILKAGEIFIKANKTKRNHFKVHAKNVTMGVRGTQFFVSNYDNVWMCVNEGSVNVSVKQAKGSVVVNAGEGVNINSNKLPVVKEYAWTKNLNWKMSGKYEKINDTTDIQSLNYDIENFDYD
jgi:ferric-dicitrate binding protein FerR (iron transport regulator)